MQPASRRLTVCTVPVTASPSPLKAAAILMFRIIISLLFFTIVLLMYTSLKNVV